ncbi:MAG: vWA domain-containing protein [Polyangiaceae bacterium]
MTLDDNDPMFADAVLNLGVPAAMAGNYGVGLDEIDSEDVTLVTFVLDMSSSMAPFSSEVISAFNTEVQALRRAKSATSFLLSTTTFADQPALLHGYLRIEQVPPLDQRSYQPSGSTALYDAVLGVFGRMATYRQTLRDNGVRSRGIVIVLSDGGDNQSTHAAQTVKQASERLLREEGTTLAYVGFGSSGSGAALKRIADEIGFPQVLIAKLSAGEIRKALGQVSQSIVQTAKAGVSASRSFF